jgi:hypothetical protein
MLVTVSLLACYRLIDPVSPPLLLFVVCTSRVLHIHHTMQLLITDNYHYVLCTSCKPVYKPTRRTFDAN